MTKALKRRNRAATWGHVTKANLASVMLAGILFGTIPVFTTPLALSGVNAEVQVTWRFVIGTPILLLFTLLVQPRGLKDVLFRNLRGFLVTGGILLGLFLTYVGSLSLGTPAATAVLLLYSQPVFTVLLSRILKERITRTRLAALVLGVSGVLVVVNPLNIVQGLGLGDALALTSGFLYALYIVTSRQVVRDKKLHPLIMTSFSFVGALAFLLPISLLVQGLYPSSDVFAGITSFNSYQIELLLGLIVIGTVIPYLALNLGLMKMEASEAGMTLMVEPVAASALGYLVLGQGLGSGQVGGACLIIASIVLLNLGSRT